MGIGQSIKKFMNEKNVTVTKISELTGIPKSTLYSAINRDTETMSYTHAQKIAKALDVPFSEFIEATYKESKEVEPLETPYMVIDVGNKNITNEALTQVENYFGANAVTLLYTYKNLNDNGKHVALERIHELMELKRYRGF